MALRVALVGMGRIGKNHLRALSGTTAAEVVGIFDQDQARARESAEAAGVGRVYESWQDVLGAASVRCVGVLLPPDLHGQYAVEGLQAGKNVVWEKPMGPTLPECD